MATSSDGDPAHFLGVSPVPLVAVLLSAGTGRRFRDSASRDQGHKLDAMLPPTSTQPPMSVFERALAAVVRAGIGPVVVVTGAWSPTPARDEWPAAVTFVHNPDWRRGQATSVLTGIEVAELRSAGRVVVGLADQPFVTADAWRSVARQDGAIVVATYGGVRANPVSIDRSVWPLLERTGDEGARTVMRIRPELVREVACPGSPHDIDTTEDLRRWQNN